MTENGVRRMIPKGKQAAIKTLWIDSDGIWIILEEGWNADGMDSNCRTIHCGGEDEPATATREDLRNQIRQIRKL